MNDESVPAGDADVEAGEKSHTRRDAIIKLGVAGATAWAVPTLMSMDAHAAGTSFPGCDCGQRLTTPWSPNTGTSPDGQTINNADGAAYIITPVPVACRGSVATFSWTSLTLSGTASVTWTFSDGSNTYFTFTSSASSGSFNFTIPNSNLMVIQLGHTTPPGTGTYSIGGMVLKFCG